MIAALNNTTTPSGPGATTGQSARVREAGIDDTSTSSTAPASPQVEASAVVSLSARAASLAAPQTAPQDASQPTATQAAATQTLNVQAQAQLVQEEEFPEPVNLIPNLVYAEADSDLNGVISPAERRAYDVVHPKLGERPADMPPQRVVDAELREYTAIANTRG